MEQRDIDLHLLEVLYGAVGQEDGWQLFLDALTQTYPDGRGIMAVHDAALHTGFASFGARFDSKTIREYNEYYVRTNPWVPLLKGRPVGLVIDSEQSGLPRKELIRTEFYQDFLRHFGSDSAVGVTLEQSDSRHLIISVVSPLRHRDPDALGRLQRLSPHMLRVAQLNRQIANLTLHSRIHEETLERMGVGLVIVDRNKIVMYMNQEAARIQLAQDGFAIRHQQLVCLNGAAEQALRRLVAEAAGARGNPRAEPGGLLRVQRSSGALPYELLVAPLPDVLSGFHAGASGAVIFIRDPEAAISVSAESLRQLYNLTPAESRLMGGLLNGGTVDGLSRQSGLSRETLRSQLKSVFGKTGVNSQAGLVRLASQGIVALRNALRGDGPHR